MSKYILSPDALEDLQDIWDFVSLDNERSADTLLDQLFETFEKLSRRPGIGHIRLI